MAGPIRQRESRLRRGRRRLWRPILASLLVHSSVLTWMGLITPQIRPRPDPPSAGPAMEVQLERITPEQPRDRSKPSAARPAAATPPRVAAAPFPPVLHRPAEAAPGPRTPVPVSSPASGSATAAPIAEAPGAAGSAGGAARGLSKAAAAGVGTAQDGRGAMRGYGRATIGCDAADFVRLSQAERDRCNQRFGEEAHKAPGPIDTIPAEKRAYYDAVAAAYRDLHTYKTPTGREPVFGTGAAGALADPVTKMPGQHAAVGCGMSFGGPRGGKGAKAKPPGLWMKVGPLLCGVSPPSGFLTEEANIPKP